MILFGKTGSDDVFGYKYFQVSDKGNKLHGLNGNLTIH